MDCIRQLFPKRCVRLPAAALTVVVGLAFACSESPTATQEGVGVSFAKGGKPGANTNDCGSTPLRITFRDRVDDPGGLPDDALRSDNGTAYVEGAGDGGVHLNGATGRLKLHTASGVNGRVVNVITDLFTYATTDRIYTNGHETETAKDLGCGFLDMAIPALDPDDPDFLPTEGSAVLEAELDAEGIVRWGKDCAGNPVDDEDAGVNERVTTRRIDESTWTVEGFFGVICKLGPKVRGKRPLTEGPAGPFFMTLEKI